ncbi:hypothetical protein ACFYZ9_17910 [Streptomyces sp. NPDC001691]|uniref:hypothetical protein n=1 Tax=unclassified Streptomyces TaxID=2593676 RepID=UPI000DEA7272|nr:hypothetical protein [Streptomyces sp. SDr-06]RCH67802.1 hypothetical protein DT019_16295 [Streptomyces sp. SDr-06]
MDHVQQALAEMMKIKGALGAAVVDYVSRVTLGTIGTETAPDLGKAGEVDTDVIRAKLHALSVLGYSPDDLEDILVTLTDEVHLIKPLAQRRQQGVFIYLVMDRHRAPLAVARARLHEIERDLEL